MTRQNKQDVLTDIMLELNLLGNFAFQRDDMKSMKLIKTINNRVVYLWGDLDKEKG